MSVRLLLNPDATAGGAGDAASQAAAQATQQAAAHQAQAAQTVTLINLSPEEFTRLKEAEGKLRQIEAENAQKLHEAEQAKLLALAESGKAREALEQLSTNATAQLTQLRQQLDATALDRDITLGTFGVAWANQDAGVDAVNKLRGEFETVEVNGQRVVRHRQTGRAPADIIPERLRSGSYAHFLAPTTQGGNGNANADRTPQDGQQQAEKPANLSMAMLDWIAKQKREEPQMAGINIHRLPSTSGRN